MPRYICDAMRIRISDCWSENNGKEYWLDLTTLDQKAEELPQELQEDDLARFRTAFVLYGCRDDAEQIKNAVIDSAIRLLEKQKKDGTRPKGKTAKLLAEMTGISENYIRTYLRLRSDDSRQSEEDAERAAALRTMKTMRFYMRYMIEKLDIYDWQEALGGLSRERELAEQVIEKLQKNIIEGDEKMKKMTVDYLLEDRQAEYLGRIHRSCPHVSEDDLFMIIMVEGSAMEIDHRMHDFCKRKKTGRYSAGESGNDVAMNEEVLWRIVEKHFNAVEEGYGRGSVYRIPWDQSSWLLTFSIGKNHYRAVIEKHRRAHIYILKCAEEGEEEMNIPESWFTEWDEAFSLREFEGVSNHEADS